MYPFGYGLSYTEFKHDIRLGMMPSPRMLRHTHRAFEIEVFVTVKNVGDYDGEESVLLFASSPLVGFDGFVLSVGWTEGVSSQASCCF